MSKTIAHTTPTESQPFEKFKGLAERLMAVPKKELDKKLAEHERKKEQVKKRKSK